MKRTLSFSMFVVAALTRHRAGLLRDADAPPSEPVERAGWSRPRKIGMPSSSTPSIADREQMAGEARSIARSHRSSVGATASGQAS